jgi:D-xylonolactonase
MTIKVQTRCVVNPGCSLGEGPVWDSEQRCLYWVDILENKIYRYDPADNTFQSWSTPEQVGFVILKHGGLIAGFKSGLHHVHLNADTTVTATRIDRVDENLDYLRFNDGMADARGRIWGCTMDMRSEAPIGKYYCYDPGLNRTMVDEGYIVANGPAVSPDGRWLYTVETVGPAKGIYRSRLNADGLPEAKKLWVDWSQRASLPDGLITDADGNVWIGEFAGHVLRGYRPDGKLKAEIELPAWSITKPAFGGEKLDVLYVTSARIGADEATLAQYPNTGGIIEVTGVGARGLASTYV